MKFYELIFRTVIPILILTIQIYVLALIYSYSIMFEGYFTVPLFDFNPPIKTGCENTFSWAIYKIV